MIGRKKLPNTAGMDGIMNMNTITTPCNVNMRLYIPALIIVRSGVNNSSRKRSAKMPPSKSENEVPTKNIKAMRLWSRVSSQERTPRSARR
jgi:hypothetical protein